MTAFNHSEEVFFPFVYARLEDLNDNLIFEHSSVNEQLLPDTEIAGEVGTPSCGKPSGAS